ncbi:MAG TPA: hypothetical protein ENL00_02995 [Nitratifractor sp.]|nr:hypothetical protein [Nitratifractor sp.]
MKKRDKISIIGTNVYSGTLCQYRQSKLTPLKKYKYSKKNITITYIANKDLITEALDISQNIPKESVVDVITDKVYDELQFDPAVEYTIVPVKTKLRASRDKYQTIIIDKKKIKEKLQPISKKSKVVDYVIPAPLLYKALYQEKSIDKSGNDMFIYFGDYDSFVTFYHNGEYLYSKSIKYSFKNIYDRFCKLANEVPMSEKQFRYFLANDGARKGKSSHRELLIRVLNECFLSINDILIYTKRAYDIDSIKSAYVALAWDSSDSLEPYVKNYLNINASALSTLFEKRFESEVTDPMCQLLILNAQNIESGVSSVANLTPYPKPKPLMQRESGKIIATGFGIASLFMIPIIYDTVIGSSMQANNLLLSKEAAKVTTEANSLKGAISRKREELKALESAYEKSKDIYDSKVGEVTKVYNKKFHYQFRSQQLSEITKLLKEYDLQSQNIAISDTLYAIELESKDDKKITAFIKKLVQKFDKNISRVDIKDIVYNKQLGLYKGVLKIDFTEEIK